MKKTKGIQGISKGISQARLAHAIATAATRWFEADFQRTHPDILTLMAKAIIHGACSIEMDKLPADSPDRAVIMRLREAWNRDQTATAHHGQRV